MIIRSITLALAATMCGQVASADIISAQFRDPTDHYAHAVLGDAIEYQTLEIKTQDEKKHRFTLPTDHVFEDIAPRLADIDGDGAPEVIVIETDMNAGAALAIYNARGKIVETPHIGTRNRWLAPIGVADFNGDGDIDVAYIDRPHLAKTLRIWTYRNGALVELARAAPLTNHKIGWDYIIGGVRLCHGTSEMVTASGDWTSIMSTHYSNNELISRRIGKFSGDASVRAALGRCD